MNSFNTCVTCKKKIIVLVGVHGSGKTSLGRRLQQDGFEFFSEIGTEMRYKTEKNVCESQEDFDLLVLEKETQRDTETIIKSAHPVVETWHIGNYAFALTRGTLIEGYDELIEKQLRLFYPLIVKLNIDENTFLSRNTEKNIDPHESFLFYKRLEIYLTEIIDSICKKGLAEIYSFTDYNYDAMKEELMDFMTSEENNHEIKGM